MYIKFIFASFKIIYLFEKQNYITKSEIDIFNLLVYKKNDSVMVLKTFLFNKKTKLEAGCRESWEDIQTSFVNDMNQIAKQIILSTYSFSKPDSA